MKVGESWNDLIGNKVHPTEKPEDLIRFYIENSSNYGDTILDPFAGSGTTAIACINTGRKYICMEKDETYFDLMADRIEKHKEKNKKGCVL